MNRNTAILIAILVILVIATWFVLQRPGEQSLAESGGRTVLSIDSAAVDRIDIQSPQDSITLVRQGADWFIDHPMHYRANQQSAKALVGALKNAQVRTLVSDNPEKQSLFQVDSSGTMVTISQNGKQAGSLIVGKMGPSYTDAYTRVAGTNAVILTDASLYYGTRRSVTEWRDKDITNMPKDQIKNIGFQYGDTTFAMTWRDSVWMIGSKVVPSGLANPLVTSLSHFETDEFLPSLPSHPHLVATINVETIQLKFFQVKGSDKYVVQSSASPQVFQIQGWRANQVLKRKNALVPA